MKHPRIRPTFKRWPFKRSWFCRHGFHKWIHPVGKCECRTTTIRLNDYRVCVNCYREERLERGGPEENYWKRLQDTIYCGKCHVKLSKRLKTFFVYTFGDFFAVQNPS